MNALKPSPTMFFSTLNATNACLLKRYKFRPKGQRIQFARGPRRRIQPRSRTGRTRRKEPHRANQAESSGERKLTNEW